MRPDPDVAPRARIPADVDQPDKIVYGLTARQMAILSVAAAAAYGIYKGLAGVLPPPMLIAVLIPIGGAAVALAMGRRDGLSLDRWLLAAVTHSRGPKHHAASPAVPVPHWAPTQPTAVPMLRLPAKAVSEGGVIDTGGRAVALVAATTVNIGLRSGQEQAALIGSYGRWLNSLGGSVQLVISAQRVDLSSRAQRIADAAATISNPALAAAAHDYALFLDQLAEHRDPLWRTVTIAVTADGDTGRNPDRHTGRHMARDTEVLRRAEHTASALATLGAQTSILDGSRAVAVLACATDPYSPADVTWARARPDQPVTGPGTLGAVFEGGLG